MRIRVDSIFGRVIALTCVLLNLGVAGAAPILDALLAPDHEPPELHIEAETRVPCAPGHDDLVCQLCRAHDRQVATGMRPAPPQPREPVGAACAGAHALAANRLATTSSEARAPPPSFEPAVRAPVQAHHAGA